MTTIHSINELTNTFNNTTLIKEREQLIKNLLTIINPRSTVKFTTTDIENETVDFQKYYASVLFPGIKTAQASQDNLDTNDMAILHNNNEVFIKFKAQSVDNENEMQTNSVSSPIYIAFNRITTAVPMGVAYILNDQHKKPSTLYMLAYLILKKNYEEEFVLNSVNQINLLKFKDSTGLLLYKALLEQQTPQEPEYYFENNDINTFKLLQSVTV